MKTYQKLITLPAIDFEFPQHVITTYINSEDQDKGYMETPNDIEELTEFLNKENTPAIASLIDHMNFSAHPTSALIHFQGTQFYEIYHEHYKALMETLLIWYNG